MMRSCALLFRLNIDFRYTIIMPPNLDYRQRNLGERNLSSLLLFLESEAAEKV